MHHEGQLTVYEGIALSVRDSPAHASSLETGKLTLGRLGGEDRVIAKRIEPINSRTIEPVIRIGIGDAATGDEHQIGIPVKVYVHAAEEYGRALLYREHFGAYIEQIRGFAVVANLKAANHS